MTHFFKLHFFVPLAAVLGLVAIAYFGAEANLGWVFGVAIPYLAILIFFEGLIYRIVQWVRSPVPFRIPTTAGQQRSLPWIKKTAKDKMDNPQTFFEVVGRMALEVLAFRTLFRNTRTELKQEPDYPEGNRLVHWSYKWLWIGALAFHYAFLLIILRHLRFFSEPTWGFVNVLQMTDGALQFFTPVIYLTDILLLAGLTYLLARRLTNPAMRYISLASDYFPLFLILGIAITGVILRYYVRTDVTAVKELAIGLVIFKPVVPAGIHPLFFAHLFLVSVLFMYFPFSKLMHMPGVFLSPTRNMANNNRWKHHENPWNYPVKYHTYMDQENEYRQAMYEAGIPLEIPPEPVEEKEQ
ncbi:MAG: sulfate reduction electron transfer complex DsrMKJOP subunit DsrM [Thermodesulfobacteriota bacterium]